MPKSSPVKNELVSYIREQIINGKLQAGSKLPSFSSLQDKFKISRGTIDKAYKDLKAQGFLYSIDRSGVYVSRHPPHAHQIALLLKLSRGECQKHTFYNALLNELERKRNIIYDKKIIVYYNVCPESNSNEYQQVINVINNNCLIGIMLTEELFADADNAFSNIPRVYIFGKKSFNQIPAVSVNEYQLWEAGLKHIRRQLNVPTPRIAIMDQIKGISFVKSEKKNLAPDIPPHWMIAAPTSSPASVEDIASLLLDYPDDKMPQAIYIGNDGLIKPVLNAISQHPSPAAQKILLLARLNSEDISETIEGKVNIITCRVSDILDYCTNVLTMPRSLVPEIQYVPLFIHSNESK
ncbi:MAG: winged helix-turn-helix transcriptional regulator [Victivallales bacterium]|nr:winged helix-turn-helix transcriptional regulator [Victivallales bacterium]